MTAADDRDATSGKISIRLPQTSEVARAERFWRASALVVFVAAATIALATFRDYGLTWDEIFQVTYSEKIAAWFTSGFSNREALTYNNLYVYGGFADLLGWFAGRLAGSPAGEPGVGPHYYEARHLVWACFGLLGLGGTYKLADAIGGVRAGTLAMTALALTPLYYGHQFNNSKDIPFAALLTWSLYAILLSARELPRPTIGRTLRVAGLIGLTIGVRVGGVFVFGYLGLLWLATVVFEWWRGSTPTIGRLAHIAGHLLSIVAVAWAVMIVFWPWAQVSPFRHPIDALGTASKFFFPYPQFFMGAEIRTDPPPLQYVPIWFSVLLPEFYFIAALAGLVLVVAKRGRSRPELMTRKTIEVLFVAFTIAFPIATVVTLRSTLYDGVRHLLFVVPAMAALVGLALAAWLEDPGRRPSLKLALLGAATISALLTAVELVRLHPYQMIYFNRFAGGLSGGASRFETDYWGLSYREGIEWLIRHPPPADRPLVVANCSSAFLTDYFLKKSADAPRYLIQTESDRTHDILLAITRWGCDKTPGEVLHVVEREGVPLLYVIRRAPPAAGTADVRFRNRR